MNANVLLNQIGPLLAKGNKATLNELKEFVLNLPWNYKDNPKCLEKLLIGPEIKGTWIEMEPSLQRRFWFRTITLYIKDYIITMTSQDSGIQFKNRISWQKGSQSIASSKEW